MNESGNYEYLKRLSLILKNETKQRNRIVWTEHHMKRKGENGSVSKVGGNVK